MVSECLKLGRSQEKDKLVVYSVRDSVTGYMQLFHFIYNVLCIQSILKSFHLIFSPIRLIHNLFWHTFALSLTLPQDKTHGFDGFFGTLNLFIKCAKAIEKEREKNLLKIDCHTIENSGQSVVVVWYIILITHTSIIYWSRIHGFLA